MKKVLFILLICLICGCGKKEVSELDKILEEKNYIIVDVRNEDEYLESHLVGSVNIPYNTITSNTNLDKSKTILVYCKSGRRSAIAKETLLELGYKVYDMGAYSKIDLPKE